MTQDYGVARCRDLKADVIDNGLCVGCGGCAAVSKVPIEMAFDAFGMLKPTLPQGVDQAALQAVCPFSGEAADEDELTQGRWPDARHDPRIGHWRGLFAGHLVNNSDRERGSSGGLTTWLLRELLRSGRVDGVLHVASASGSSEKLFEYKVSRTDAELNAGRGSRYYPIEISAVMDEVRRVPGRYAIVAIPCVAKTVRNLMRCDPVLNERVVIIVGLVCGHLKSKHFADYLAWLGGVRFGALKEINFRRKIASLPASDYGVTVDDGQRSINTGPLKDYFATSWEVGVMRNPACDFCDDVLAETADIVFGDAWLPPFDSHWLGTNVVLTRDASLHTMMVEGAAAGDLNLSPISADEMASSQAGGLRHRREGLGHRLKRRHQTGVWAPRKRFGAGPSLLGSHREATYDQRAALTAMSHAAFRASRACGQLLAFQILMTPSVVRYYAHIGNLKRALLQSPPGRAFRRFMFRLRRGHL